MSPSSRPTGPASTLFAWLTLASSDETSFVNADTQAVAGRVNREDAESQPREGGPLDLQCWPMATTSDIPLEQFQRMARGRGIRRRAARTSSSPAAGCRRPEPDVGLADHGDRASQENLGDLKLYRIPEPVTVAANSQKQVALLTRPDVRIALVYRQGIYRSARLGGDASRPGRRSCC